MLVFEGLLLVWCLVSFSEQFQKGSVGSKRGAGTWAGRQDRKNITLNLNPRARQPFALSTTPVKEPEAMSWQQKG